jgi:nanoRNase/pAp phosphatase (c-di-AMP/oligoRNAs hydrolase)
LARPPDAAEKRLEQLAHHLHGKRRLLIVTHDNPDPDTIATGWALLRLARRLRRMRVDLAYGGIIGRGENQALLEVLKVPLRRLEELDPVAVRILDDAEAHAGPDLAFGDRHLAAGIGAILHQLRDVADGDGEVA